MIEAPACLMRATLVLAAALGGCAASPGAVVAAYPQAATPTGHALIALQPAVYQGIVRVDGKQVAAISSWTDTVVIQRLPVGLHDVEIAHESGETARARIQIARNWITHAYARFSPAGARAPERPAVFRASPPRPAPSAPRPCERLTFVLHGVVLLPMLGVRLCASLGRHVTAELIAASNLAQTAVDVGPTVHLGPSDSWPYLAVRVGGEANIIFAGEFGMAAFGWRVRRWFFEIGAVLLRVRTGDPDHPPKRDWVVLPAATVGWPRGGP